jgi:hypothetical protein
VAMRPCMTHATVATRANGPAWDPRHAWEAVPEGDQACAVGRIIPPCRVDHRAAKLAAASVPFLASIFAESLILSDPLQ